MTPRAVALTLGVAYAVLTALELLIGQWRLGEVEILQRTTKVNLLHWAAALALLGSFFAGSGASRIVTRVLGLAFLGIAAWGFLAPDALGSFLGFPDEIPALYNVYHALTAVAALAAGLLSVEGKA